MRIRSIKPEFWTSDDIAALDWPTRLLFIGLWSYVDDNGVGRDNDKLIKADLFPLEDDPRETLATVSRGLQELCDGGQIARYEVDGKPLLYVNAWESHQRIDRPNKARYPLPTCENAISRDTLATPSRVSRADVASGAGEQGNRGTGEKTPSSAAADGPSVDDEFEEWWSHYPRKVGKQGALKAYRRARKAVDADVLFEAIKVHGPKIALAEDRFRPHASTWLNEGRWEDEIESTQAATGDDGWFQPFTPPPAPPEIADDPAAYQQFVQAAAAEWRAGGGRQ